MEKFRLGRTGLMVSRSGFGAIPIQRLNFEEAGTLLRKAYEGGINFYDTARGYTDSEEKIGKALSDVRKDIILATKTFGQTEEDFFKQLETSLTNLRTDYIDIYQFHNPPFLPEKEHEMYQAALKAKQQGKIRFISITSHKIDLAIEMVRSGLFDTMQFPDSAISDEKDLELVNVCREHDVGLIAMKALAGGLITDAVPTFAFLRHLGNVLPIWGLQHMWELEQFLKLEEDPPEWTAQLQAEIKKERDELSGDFCRACGYCAPTCPAKIEISMAARMSLLLRRMNTSGLVSPQGKERMERIKDCTDCGVCKTHCPYGLDTPALLRRELKFYQEFLEKAL